CTGRQSTATPPVPRRGWRTRCCGARSNACSNVAKGFTLPAMMVVVAIIAIRAMMAPPNTQDRVIRGQIVEAAPLAGSAQARIAQAWAGSASVPADNAAAGLPMPARIVNNFVSAVAVEQGAIHLTFGNRASPVLSGHVLTLRPAVIADAPVVPVTWVCAGASA